MTRSFKRVKACVILSIFLISILAVFIPSSTAQRTGFQGCDAQLKVKAKYPKELQEKVIPLHGAVRIELEVGYLITGIFMEPTARRLSSMGVPASIHLEAEPVGEAAPYVTAVIENALASPEIKNPDIEEGGGWSWDDSPVLTVSFEENAPAIKEVAINIKMRSEELSAILWYVRGTEVEQPIAFTPAFLPIIDATPRSTYKEISPGEMAEFYIDLENLGNAKTEYIFDIISVPKGWSASIVSSTKVGSTAKGEDNTKAVKLLVQPPYSFGYHNDREDIKVTVYGRYFAGTDGDIANTTLYTLTFTVRSRGFSTPGFELATILFAFIAVFFILIIKRRKRN